MVDCICCCCEEYFELKEDDYIQYLYLKLTEKEYPPLLCCIDCADYFENLEYNAYYCWEGVE